MQSFTRAERQAAIAASRDPSVRRAAWELASKADDAGLDPDAAVDAHQLLAAAVADALAVLTPDASETANDFAMQAALFAVGAHVFIAPPDTDMTEWIGSMPDEALNGLRTSMADTARAMGRPEVAARIASEPKRDLASILAESVPRSASGVITDLAFVGWAADRNGHDFARKVEKRLAELGWKMARELGLAQFGGANSLGDVDVLCWRPSSGVVYAVECKSLRFDSTLGEIGERLAEYSAGTVGGKRTPLQKHLDRISFFEANRKALAVFTGIPEHRLRLLSGLVTEGLGSLQFGGAAREMLDVVTDYEMLEDQLTDL